MIKAVIFDFFGVIADDGWLPFKSKYFGNDPSKMDEATRHNRLSDSGAETYEQFIAKVAAMANISEAQAKREVESNPVNLRVIDYIATQLRPHYKIGLLSNTAKNWFEEILLPEQVKLFDQVSLSFQTGFVKPDSRSYREITNKLSIQPHEGIFIDDQSRYADAANDCGMRGITYKDFDTMREELNKILADSNN